MWTKFFIPRLSNSDKIDTTPQKIAIKCKHYEEYENEIRENDNHGPQRK